MHLIRRGNNRCAIFTDDYDRELFLALLETTSARHRVAVNAYCLMSNHYHAIVTPPSGIRLSLMMQDLGRDYVRKYNERHDRVGTLWSGKPTAIPILDERYWMTCLRYVEQNPIRAQIVREAAEYSWSTYRVHAFGEPHAWIARHRLYIALGQTDAERQEAYRAVFAETLTAADVIRQRLTRRIMKSDDCPTSRQFLPACAG